jgi:hypothetical protein
MRRFLSNRTLALAGAVALASAALWSIIGFALYGRPMVPNLLAELAGVSVEIGIVVLIIDRVAAAHRRRQWAYAYSALSDRAAITFVDVMRLLSIRASESGLQTNGDRYDEFYELAGLHLAEFRSNIEGFAGSLEPTPHEALRRVDRHLSWATSKLATKPASAAGRLEFVDLMRETAVTLERFLRDNGGPSYQAEVDAVDTALREVSSKPSHDGVESSEDRLIFRLQAQNALLRVRGGPRPRPQGIWYDANNDLALAYFLIDHHMLTQNQAVR